MAASGGNGSGGGSGGTAGRGANGRSRGEPGRRRREGREFRQASPARRAAFAVLRRLERKDGRAPPRPDSLLARLEDREGRPPDDRDRALARELVFGVLRFRRTLDWALASHTRRPLADLDAPTRTALRLGLYQLRYLGRVPARAAVHDSVSLANRAGGRRAAGFVNAVLRTLLRADHPWPHRGGDPDLYLRTGLSHPDWLVDRLLAALGPRGARARLEANNRRPSVFLWVSQRRDLEAVREQLAREGIPTDRFPLAPRCLLVNDGNPLRSPLHREGAIHLQDAGSQLVGWLLPAGGRAWLDACAAPGGKAAIQAARAAPRQLVAADVRPARVRLLTGTAERLGTGNLLPLTADAARPPFRPGSFDRILLDVPCSGLGTLARNPDIKWTASPARLATLARDAARLARAQARLLAPGGLLLYAACSLEPEETGEVIRELLAETPGLGRAPLQDRLPEPLAGLVGDDGALRLAPEDHGTDGYFAALLVRRDEPRRASGRDPLPEPAREGASGGGGPGAPGGRVQQPVDKAPRMGIRPRRDREPRRPGGGGALSPPDGGPNRWRDPFRPLSRGGRTLPGGASCRVGARGTFSTACQGVPGGSGGSKGP